MEGHGKEREYVAVSLLQAGDVSCWWRVALLFPFSSVLWLDTSGASVLLYSGRPPAHAPWSKPTFYKIISHVYTHKRMSPIIWQPAGLLAVWSGVTGSSSRRWVDGCLPRCGFLRALTGCTIPLTNQTPPPQRPATILLKCKNHGWAVRGMTVRLISSGDAGVNVVGEERLGDWEGF